MGRCECGCGEDANTREFAPGHDQKLRTSLERRVGGLLALRTLIDASDAYFQGETTEEAFTKQIRAILSKSMLRAR